MNDTDTSTAAGLAQADRLLAIDSALGADALLMTRLDGEDAISRCFLYRVEVIATVPDASVEALLGEPVTLWIMSDGPDTRRPINGHVRSVAGLGHDVHGHRRFELEVVPRLWFLSCTCDCRIFQHLSVPDILRTVFNEQGLTNVAFRVVQENYKRLDYCVQFEESALDFVSRLMEHLGVFYWHEHSADKHLLVIGDRNAAAGMCEPASVTLSENRQTGEIQTLDFRSVFRPGKWTLNDYDFESPTKRLLVNTATTLAVPRMPAHEIYRWAGEFVQQDSGRALSRLRMEMEEARQRVVSGTGHCAGFDPGRRVSIATTWNDTGKVYLLTEVRHHAIAPGFEAGGQESSYSNEFVAIAATTPFRPPLVTPKPVMRGAQTATVVGPPGESVFCDPFGRVRVQFHWDRLGQRNDRSSCWIRVGQSRAGSFYGSLAIPHVGHEVIVAFLEGDPDRPLIVGSVPNALTMPPVELPFDKHKTIQRDHGDNRMIMQGKPGQEHLSLVSPRRVNMFATRRGARPLSAGVDAVANPVINTFSDKDKTPYPIQPFEDQTGLFEVWEGWYLLTHPGVTQIPGPNGSTIDLNDANFDDDTGQNLEGNVLKATAPTPASSSSTQVTLTPGTSGSTQTLTTFTPAAGFSAKAAEGVAMTADECDINSFTEGRNNAVSLGNKNTWVYADNNTWVNGNSNSEIMNDSNSTVHGHSESTIKHGSSSWIYEDAISGVLGDRTTMTLGTSQTLIGGVNLTLRVGFSSTINLAVCYDAKGVKLDDAVADIRSHVFHSHSTAGKFWEDVAVITGAVLRAAHDDLRIHA